MISGRAIIVKASKTSSLLRRILRKEVLALAVAASMAGGAWAAGTPEFFDWLAVNAATTPDPSFYTPAPVLDNTPVSIAAAQAVLTANAAAGRPLAVKVGVTLTPATIAAIYNNFNIKYTFADFEGPNALNDTTNLVNQVKGSTLTGPSVTANTSFIGNYTYSPLPNDLTRPGGSASPTGNSPANPYAGANEFNNSGVNMVNEQLYPGDPSFRNPINTNSTAPNIKSAMFTLPIQRLSGATQNMLAGTPHIPYISRFNDFAGGVVNSTAIVNGKVQNAFDTSKPGAAGQLLSRNDFEALALHYRMRGATSYHLLDPGVVGYTQAQEEADAKAGWTNPLVAGVLAGTNGRYASLGTTINVDGSVKSIEDAGVVWSAVTNNDTGVPGLAILVSNLSPASHAVSFNARINGATLTYASGSLAAGSHTILRFTKSGTSWGLSPLMDPAFNDPTLASNDGVGIPEPASISLLSIGAFGILLRRRRKA